uniref:F-box domain-containing protein n=1 Tax=Salix viminalis TaxID=40686 RepID=A0A6N2M6V4_SALVM
MRRSKSAGQSQNPNITKLPDDLILKILSNIQDDTKTLIRCSSVCKNLHSLVSEIDTVSLRSLCQNEGGGGEDEHTLLIMLAPRYTTIIPSPHEGVCKSQLCSFPSSSSLHVSRLNCMIGDGDSIHCE